METYEKAEIEPILKEALVFQDSALKTIKDLEEKNASLIEALKASEEQNVVLQKVANEEAQPAFAFDSDQLSSTVQSLVDGAYLDESQSEKFASEIQEDPSRILPILDRIVTLSLSPSSGQGINKRAGSDLSDSDAALAKETAAWIACVETGA
jgi:hypothetical protein